ncbi:rhomboid family intramembrane serine protease [Halorubellus salinus]|uniref:rhomboid family intramembrane serine protease n=1 Tax=Halorubellus salinus TaxID=755309 RepID=UPI001D097C19|nr:rhomboid family intramembrane serine protease [Halorubellus salinus]
MATCDECGKQENMPYTCSHCGSTYCGEHRLPEKHDCPGLTEWNDPKGVFDSGFDDSVGSESSGRSFSLFGPGGALSYFRGNMTYVFLALMFVTWLTQWLVLNFVGRQAYLDVFILSSDNPLYVWTWVTSIFAHAPPPSLGHIAGNAIVIFFFGRLVEDIIGSRDFTLLFLGTGMLAGLSQIGLAMAMNPGIPSGVLGASGAALAILGVLTILAPDLKVYIYFILPVPIWAITIFYALISSLAIIGGGIGAGGTAQAAHLVGLAIGLAYGKYIEGDVRRPQSLGFGGGRGPGGPGGPGGRRRF